MAEQCRRCGGFVAFLSDTYGSRKVCLSCGRGEDVVVDNRQTPWGSDQHGDPLIKIDILLEWQHPGKRNYHWRLPSEPRFWAFSIYGKPGYSEREPKRRFIVHRMEVEPKLPPDSLAPNRATELKRLIGELVTQKTSYTLPTQGVDLSMLWNYDATMVRPDR